MTTFREAIAGAQYRADQSVNGVGPHSGDRTTDPEWRTLINDAVRYAWRVASAARPDFQVVSSGSTALPDYTVVAGTSASVAVPADFYDLIDFVYGPDTTSEYSLGPFTWQNRRAPGGWPAPLFLTGGVGGSSCRLMGSTIYIEPSTRAGGIYRIWYCPQVKTIRADFTVDLATAGGLSPGPSSAGGPGIGKTLTGSANSVLTVDGVVVTNGQIILVKNQLNGIDNGIYTVTSAGSGASPYILTRSNVTVTAAGGHLGTMVQTSAGATNVDVFFETTSLTTVVDSTAWTWAEAFLDPILADHAPELIKIKTAIPAIDRDDDLSLTQLNKDLLTQSTQFAAYLKQVRTANGPQKMIDTDSFGPRGYGGW